MGTMYSGSKIGAAMPGYTRLWFGYLKRILARYKDSPRQMLALLEDKGYSPGDAKAERLLEKLGLGEFFQYKDLSALFRKLGAPKPITSTHGRLLPYVDHPYNNLSDMEAFMAWLPEMVVIQNFTEEGEEVETLAYKDEAVMEKDDTLERAILAACPTAKDILAISVDDRFEVAKEILQERDKDSLEFFGVLRPLAESLTGKESYRVFSASNREESLKFLKELEGDYRAGLRACEELKHIFLNPLPAETTVELFREKAPLLATDASMFHRATNRGGTDPALVIKALATLCLEGKL